MPEIQIPIPPVEDPILCSPYEEPACIGSTTRRRARPRKFRRAGRRATATRASAPAARNGPCSPRKNAMSCPSSTRSGRTCGAGGGPVGRTLRRRRRSCSATGGARIGRGACPYTLSVPVITCRFTSHWLRSVRQHSEAHFEEREDGHRQRHPANRSKGSQSTVERRGGALGYDCCDEEHAGTRRRSTPGRYRQGEPGGAWSMGAMGA